MEGRRSPKIRFVASLAILVALIGILPETKSEQNATSTAEEGPPYNCMRLVMRAAKSVVKVLSNCTRRVKATSKNNVDFGEKMGCVMKCALHDANITTPDYLITRESLLPLMKKMIPNEFMIHELHTFLMDHCEHAAAQIKPEEEKCLSYSDYIACLLSTFEEFMNTSPYCIKRKKKGGANSEGSIEVSIG